MGLGGQRVVVIGGTSGMGLATARAAAEEGATVTIASSNASKVDAALGRLPEGTRGRAVDLRREEDVAALFTEVGALDHLVITAGDGFAPTPVAQTSPADVRQTLDVRFLGAVAAVRHALPQMREGGSIGFTTGQIAVRPVPGAALATAVATAVEGLALGLAVELAPLRVNVVRPGPVETEMWDAIPAAHRAQYVRDLAGRTLTGAVGQPDQVAAAFLYAMQNHFVTGTVLPVDGGVVLR